MMYQSRREVPVGESRWDPVLVRGRYDGDHFLAVFRSHEVARKKIRNLDVKRVTLSLNTSLQLFSLFNLTRNFGN